MTDLMKIVLLLSVSGTVLAAALALLRRILRNKLPKAVFYYLWLLVLLRLIVPVALPVPGLELPAPEQTVVTPPLSMESAPADQRTPIPVDPSYVVTVPRDPAINGSGTALSGFQPRTPWYEAGWSLLCRNFAAIWLTGAALHFLWFAGSYFRFSRSLKRDCRPLLEHEQALLDNLRGRVQVVACRSPLAGTPMLLGLFRPRIVLPETPITTRELECILRHELTHLRRWDLPYKWFTVAVTSLHWFNPFMPWLRKEISRCGELSCDERVIGPMDDDHKRLYGETLLALAAANALPRAVPATTLCEEKKQLRERLLGIKKYHKTTLLMAVLSVLLALLVAGCAAVLGPQLKKETFTGPLTEEQQAPVLENIKAWAEENVETEGTHTLDYVCQPEKAYGVGMLSSFGWDSYLYDLHTGEIRLIDGTYPDSADLGRVQLTVKDGEDTRAFHVFHLTGGDPAKATSPFTALDQLAADYPQGKVTQLQWYRKHGQYLYIRVDFASDGAGYCFEFTSINGQSNVRDFENALQREQGMTIPVLVQSLKAVVGWQESHSSAHDQENYMMGNWAPSWVYNMMKYGDFSTYGNTVVYDLSTDEIAVIEESYAGSTEYGAFTLLYPAENPQQWVYIVDESGEAAAEEPTPDLTGKVAVLTKNAPLDNAFVETVDAAGRTVVMDMAMALRKGDLVYVESQTGETCAVTVLAGEPPRPQGQLDVAILSTEQRDLEAASQVILNNTPIYDAAGGKQTGSRSGVAQVEIDNALWLKVALPGGEDPFWVREDEVVFEWPLPQPLPPWVPAEADPAAKITSWTYGEAEGQPQIVVLEVEDPPAHRAWHWDGITGSMMERTARNTRRGSDLTVGQLPAVLNGLTAWLEQNEPLWQASHTVTFTYQDANGYKQNFGEDAVVLVYSLADGRAARLNGDYTGSENYGLLSVTVNGQKENKPYYLLIDDHPLPEEPSAENSALYDKTAAWLEEEFQRVYDPYYDIQQLTISNWQETGNEATFYYTMTFLYYNRDPDTVPYIQEAKAKDPSSYKCLYEDYLALKTANHRFRMVWDGDAPALSSDVSVNGAPEWKPVKIDDYVLL